MSRALILSLVVGLSVLAGRAEGATRVTLDGGGVLIGEIVSHDEATITFALDVGGGTQEVVIDKREVRTIELDFDPAGEAPVEQVPRPKAQPNDAYSAPTRYLLVPISGAIDEGRRVASRQAAIGFGGENIDGFVVTAAGVADALKFAIDKGIEHVVFDIDTPGGSVDEAQAIQGEIAAARELAAVRSRNLYLYALVRHSISAGMVITLSCDRVFMLPSATQGAALAWSHGPEGHPEVDAKFNAIWGKQLRGLAEANGHSGAIAQAMVILEAEVWAWRDEQGQLVVAEYAPSGDAAELIQVDRDDTILHLSARQAIDLGFASALSGPDSIGETLGLTGWTQLGNYGAASMKRAHGRIAKAESARRDKIKECEKKIAEFDALLAKVPAQIQTAQEKDPSNWTYSYYRDTGMLTPAAKRQWTQRTDTAIEHWRAVESAVERAVELHSELKSLRKDLERAEPYPAFEGRHEAELQQVEHDIESVETTDQGVSEWQRLAKSEIRRLASERNRHYR